MGVTGLWNLIQDAGTRVNVERLSNKVLAIDLSIWINQAIKGFRDKDGRSVANAHLLGLFYRICKLLFYQIKPIVVFDGDCPALKFDTIRKRLERKQKCKDNSKKLSLYLEKYIKDAKFLSKKEKDTLIKLKNDINRSKIDFTSENYFPPQRCKQVDIYQNFADLKDNKIIISDEDEDEDNPEETSYNHPYFQNIEDIDINSEQFKSLPIMTRYEILIELKESYKQRKIVNTNLLPQEADTFSNFQLAKLLKKRNLQVEIDNTITEMNTEIVKDYIEDLKNKNINSDLLNLSSSQIITGTLASDENTHCILIKRLNQAIDEFNVSDDEDDDIKEEENDSQEQIYKLPNSLPGQSSEIETYDDRIEFLSNISQAFNNKFPAKKLSTNINKNFAKYSSKSSLNEMKLDLSDNESSTDDEDFIEVENDEKNLNLLNIFDESVPYDTNYTLKIHVNDEPLKSDIQEEKINKDVEEITVENDVDKDRIEKPDEAEDNQSNLTTTIDDKCLNETSCNLPNPVPPKPLDIEPLIEASKESIKLDRQANSVTKQMIIDCQELLRLFGIPWIVAPAEAEAQCAILEELNLSQGTITDDSDIFLFGGKNVYKNFFNNSKHIFHYNIDDLKKYYGLDRSKLICLGMLCGTDYTVGIEGIGPVTGLEILSQFSGEGIKSLQKFADWHRKKMKKKYGPENTIRQKFLKYILPETFPSRMVFDAYNNANVDNSTQPFSWAMPQLSELTIFARQQFGWSEAKAEAFLLPVLKNLNSKQTQQKIDLYFKPSGTPNSAIADKLKFTRSKRLNEAIRKNIKLSLNNQSTSVNVNPRKKRRLTKKKELISKTNSKSRPNQTDLVLSEESSSD